MTSFTVIIDPSCLSGITRLNSFSHESSTCSDDDDNVMMLALEYSVVHLCFDEGVIKGCVLPGRSWHVLES